MPQKSKKLVPVLAVSISMTEKIEEKLEWVLCIWYPIIFKDWIEALLDLGSKINVIN